MSTPILATKLYIPLARPNHVARPRLIARLNDGLEGKLTLISAPAGFGKSTLVSSWIGKMQSVGASQPESRQSTSINRVAWLSLDETDNEPNRFLAYIVAALQTISTSIGSGVLPMLQSPQPSPIDSVLATLLNEITTALGGSLSGDSLFGDPLVDDSEQATCMPEQRILLVLDDYHVIKEPAIGQAMGFLLEHLPPQMHLIMTTREDPDLPLSRYRVRNQLTELRAADLRFTSAEAADFLNQVMGLTLTETEIAALEARTEGWVAGLQLAAISIQSRAESGENGAGRFIQAFTGSNRFVLDYLVEEVLQSQPEAVRSFLLETSILDRLSGPLCDAVTGFHDKSTDGNAYDGKSIDGKSMLASLEHDNLFLIPLDDERQWYRYHHLFADMLRTRSVDEQPQLIPLLHQRASQWCEENGFHADAVRHAFSAEDFEQAANLIELSWREMDRNYQNPTSLSWLDALPAELIRARPVLSVGYGWALLAEGELEAAETRLRDAERWLDPSIPKGAGESSDMVVVDQEEFRKLPATIASARTYMAQAHGNTADTIQYAQLALELLPEDDTFERAIPAAILGLAKWANGELEAAYQSFAGVMESFSQADYALHVVGTSFVVALIRLTQGRLREASAIYNRSLEIANQQDEPILRGTADLHMGLANLYREWGDLDLAAHHLHTSNELGDAALLPGNEYNRYIVSACLKESQGALDEALTLLDSAARLQKRDPIPDVWPVAARKAQIWIRLGRFTDALGWARERNLTVEDDLNYLQEFEHITLARLFIAWHLHKQPLTSPSFNTVESIPNVIGLLERLLHSAEAGERTGSIIEILMLKALAQYTTGDIAEALLSLERALLLARAEGYVHTFVGEGPPMADLLAQLLRELSTRSVSESNEDNLLRAYAERLLAAFEPIPDAATDPIHDVTTSSSSSTDERPATLAPQNDSLIEPLIEPLSPRELEVLELVAQGLSNQEISERLFLALSTVKGHNRIIFGKLHVQRRTEAVARARELRLI